MSNINLECSTGIFLILLFLMGSKHVLGTDGDLDADLKSLLPGGTLCVLLQKGDVDFSLDLSLDLYFIPTTNGPWLRNRSCSVSEFIPFVK